MVHNETKVIEFLFETQKLNLGSYPIDIVFNYSDIKGTGTYIQQDRFYLHKRINTISDTKYFSAFESDKYQNISITFHSSKGLEFDQIIVFAEDYRLSDNASLYNHYVAVTRAKSKLIIAKINNYSANLFQENLEKIFAKRGLNISKLVSIE